VFPRQTVTNPRLPEGEGQGTGNRERYRNGELVNADVRSGVKTPGAAKGNRFPRSARLLKHSDFDRVYKQGRRHFLPHITVFYLRREEGGARVGFTVGRVLGGATARNRIKRRLREAVRLEQVRVQGPADIVINPKKSVLTMEFPLLQEEISRAFELIAGRLGVK